MNYEDLKAAELRALCEERGLKVHRAKADMIEELEAYDATHGPETPSEPLPEPEPPISPEKPAEEPTRPTDDSVWVEDGTLHRRYLRSGILTDFEHLDHLADIAEEALSRGYEPYGPSFRVRDPDSATWVYGVNIR